MKSQSLAKFIKSRWLFAVVAVAIAAFVAGIISQIQPFGIVDDAVGKCHSDTTPAFDSGDSDESGSVFKDVEVIRINPDGTWPTAAPTPAIEALAQSQANATAPIPDWATGAITMGMLMCLDGRELQLPDDVYVIEIVDDRRCHDISPCPAWPVYVLARGEDRVAIDRYGDVMNDVAGLPGENPAAFPFLPEFQGD